MQPNDKPKFLSVLNGLAAIKPGAKLTQEALSLYWGALSAWNIEDFTAAANELARTQEFMPNPYHFEQLRKAGRMTAGEAWAEVLAIARNGGGEHESPLVNSAVRAIGGYRAVGMSHTDATHFLEKRFCEHYDSIGEREDIREAIPQIAGPAKHISAVAQLLLTKTRAS